MDRYFFHIDFGEVTRDEDGTELPSLLAAKAATVHLVGELLKDEGDAFWAKPDLTVTVTDASNLTLWTLSATGMEAASVKSFQPKTR